jgi:Rrf2 family protein
MLSLPQTTSYAILTLSCLGVKPDSWVMTKHIAAWTRIPLPFLSKVLHLLADSGLIQAKSGTDGGFQLTRPAKEISLLEVVEASGKHDCFDSCLLGNEECSDERNCPAHEYWKEQRTLIKAKLDQLTVEDVMNFEQHDADPLQQDATFQTSSEVKL